MSIDDRIKTVFVIDCPDAPLEQHRHERTISFDHKGTDDDRIKNFFFRVKIKKIRIVKVVYFKWLSHILIARDELGLDGLMSLFEGDVAWINVLCAATPKDGCETMSIDDWMQGLAASLSRHYMGVSKRLFFNDMKCNMNGNMSFLYLAANMLMPHMISNGGLLIGGKMSSSSRSALTTGYCVEDEQQYDCARASILSPRCDFKITLIKMMLKWYKIGHDAYRGRRFILQLLVLAIKSLRDSGQKDGFLRGLERILVESIESFAVHRNGLCLLVSFDWKSFARTKSYFRFYLEKMSLWVDNDALDLPVVLEAGDHFTAVSDGVFRVSPLFLSLILHPDLSRSFRYAAKRAIASVSEINDKDRFLDNWMFPVVTEACVLGNDPGFYHREVPRKHPAVDHRFSFFVEPKRTVRTNWDKQIHEYRKHFHEFNLDGCTSITLEHLNTTTCPKLQDMTIAKIFAIVLYIHMCVMGNGPMHVSSDANPKFKKFWLIIHRIPNELRWAIACMIYTDTKSQKRISGASDSQTKLVEMLLNFE